MIPQRTDISKPQFFCENSIVETEVDSPKAKIPLKPSDLKVLLFPDERTREMASADPDIRRWFGDPPEFPVIATVEERLHF